MTPYGSFSMHFPCADRVLSWFQDVLRLLLDEEDVLKEMEHLVVGSAAWRVCWALKTKATELPRVFDKVRVVGYPVGLAP